MERNRGTAATRCASRLRTAVYVKRGFGRALPLAVDAADPSEQPIELAVDHVHVAVTIRLVRQVRPVEVMPSPSLDPSDSSGSDSIRDPTGAPRLSSLSAIARRVSGVIAVNQRLELAPDDFAILRELGTAAAHFPHPFLASISCRGSS